MEKKKVKMSSKILVCHFLFLNLHEKLMILISIKDSLLSLVFILSLISSSSSCSFLNFFSKLHTATVLKITTCCAGGGVVASCSLQDDGGAQ
jgi:hypothetical protein